MSHLTSDELDRISAYLAGVLPSEENAAVAAWMAEDTRREAAAQILARATTGLYMHRAPYVDTATLTQRLSQHIGSGIMSQEEAPQLIQDTSRPAQRTAWWPGAASRVSRARGAIAMLCAAALVIAGFYGVLHMDGGTRANNAPPSVFATTTGQQAHIRLSDGTVVTLAPQTTLRVSEGFGSRARAVELQGQAHFTVHSTPSPFVVRTGNIETRVLGTGFTIRRYPTDAAAEVAVISGKVNVMAKTSRAPSVTLMAGMVGTVTDSSATATDNGGAQAYVSWTSGRLVFKEVQTSAILATLARWYDYKFVLADSSLAHTRLTVWLSTESSDAALSTLKLALNADITIRDNTVTFSRRKHTGAVPPQPRAVPAIPTRLSRQSLEVGR